MNRGRLAALVASVSATTLLVAGCTSAAGGDKSGGSPSPTVLMVANNDGTLDGVPGLVHFADRVAELSDGDLTIRVESRWKGGDDELKVIEDVAAGNADLGWAGTRAFDRAGVDDFRPLHAPFLISSYAAQATVLGDRLADDLVQSVDGAGLTGLALVADELRHPAGVAGPLLAPEDFRGTSFLTIASGAQSDGLAALGAESISGSVQPVAAAGELGGLEAMWWSYASNNYPQFAPYITANVTLWPRTWVLFADPDMLRELGGKARGWLTQAADETAAWSLEHASDNEPAEIARACVAGARVASASPEEVAALRVAVEPVYNELREDRALRKTLQRIEGLISAAAEDPAVDLPAGCAYEPGEEGLPTAAERILAAPGDPGKLPTGRYRYSHSVDDLLAQGQDDEGAALNAGVWTWTLGDGTWSYRQDPATAEAVALGITRCEGFYDVRGGTAAFTTTAVFAGGDCAPPTWTAGWKARGGRLDWSSVNVADFAYLFAAGGWQRIG